MEWYEPVDIWDVFNVSSREDFVDKYVVSGIFHSKVPEDISKSFMTVSYLLAHSYYHLPMFDEALSKALLIMEMAVKLKAQDLDIVLKNPANKKGHKYDKKLGELINEICSIEELAFLKDDFDRARNIRNYKMHPSRHSFGGTMSYATQNSRLFVNIINLLFLDNISLKKMQLKIDQLEDKLAPFKKGLYVLEFNGNRILVDGFHTFKYREFEENSLLLLCINPLTTKVEEQFIQKKYPDPLIIGFSKYEIGMKSVKGLDLDGNPILIYIDDKPANLKIYFDYNEALSKVTEADMDFFLSANSQRSLWIMERFIYDNCWENEPLINVN